MRTNVFDFGSSQYGRPWSSWPSRQPAGIGSRKPVGSERHCQPAGSWNPGGEATMLAAALGTAVATWGEGEFAALAEGSGWLTVAGFSHGLSISSPVPISATRIR